MKTNKKKPESYEGNKKAREIFYDAQNFWWSGAQSDIG